MSKIKVENSHLVRDDHSKALLSTDRNGLEKYLHEKNQKEQEQVKFAEIDSLKEDIQELKKLVLELVQQRNSE
jgi:hypothetical protein